MLYFSGENFPPHKCKFNQFIPAGAVVFQIKCRIGDEARTSTSVAHIEGICLLLLTLPKFYQYLII